MGIDRDFTLEMLQSLVRIDSRNPGLEPGAPGERELARHVQRVLAGLGWATELHELGEGRANLVARRAGTGAGPSLMVNVHLDTVGTGGMADPFAGEHRDGRVWGRGAQDTKGGMAAVLAMARALGEGDAGPAGDLVLAFVADEENESIGTADLVRRVRTDAAVVIEPSDLDVVVGHRGFGVFRIRTAGRVAHGGRPDLGIDANMHMGHVLAELDRVRRTWWTSRRHPAMGPASLHVPVLEGGRHLFVYAGRCTADVECRTIPGQEEASVRRDLQAVLDGLAERVPDFDASLETVLWRPAHEIDPERPVVRAALEAARAVRGDEARLAHHTWWEDSGLLAEAGIDAVIIGPRGGGMHTAEEWVDVDSVVDLAEILRRTALRFCGGPAGTPGRKDGESHE